MRNIFKKREVAAESIDLNDAACEVVALLLNESQSDRSQVRHVFTEKLLTVKGARIQIQRVILNWMRNRYLSAIDVPGHKADDVRVGVAWKRLRGDRLGRVVDVQS